MQTRTSARLAGKLGGAGGSPKKGDAVEKQSRVLAGRGSKKKTPARSKVVDALEAPSEKKKSARSKLLEAQKELASAVAGTASKKGSASLSKGNAARVSNKKKVEEGGELRLRRYCTYYIWMFLS